MGTIKKNSDRASRASVFCLACCLLLVLLIGPQAGSTATRVQDKAVTPAQNGAVPAAAHAHADFAFAEPWFETLGQGKSPNTIITALLQDTQGWLWIGTHDGLFRYDGYRMRKFAHDASNPTALAGDFVTALWQATDGRLWVGTNSDGVSIFDPQTEQFTHLRHDPARAASLAGGRVWALAGDGKGGVWIGTNQGLDYFKGDGVPPSLPSGDGVPPNASLHHYRHEPNNPASLLDNRICSLLFDKQGTLWVGSVGGLQRYQAAGPGKLAGIERVASTAIKPDSLAGKEIRTLFQARDGKLWLGTKEHGAAWLNLAEPDPAPRWLPADPKRADRLSNAWVQTIIEPQAGQIWLGTAGGGVNIVAAQDGTVLHQLQHDSANASSLAHNAIWTLVKDQSGMLWIGTWGAGLQRHHPAQQAFKVLRHRRVGPGQAWPDTATGLSHPDVKSVLELADGRILVGTGGNGIDILDRKRGVVGGYRPNQPDGLPDGTIEALAQTPDGTIWAGSQQAGVLRLFPGGAHWQASAEGLPSTHVLQFLLDQSNVLWVATSNGIARWQADSQRFVTQQQLDGSALQVTVQALAEDRQGRLWAASANGLWLKNPQASGWQVIRHQPGQAGSLPGDDVRALWVDASGHLWVNGTKGLVRLQSWNGRTPVFEAISTRAGQQGQGRNGMLWQDRQGRIWVKTAMLTQPLPGTVHFADNNRPDIGQEWVGVNGLSRDGLFMYGGSQGLAIFDPGKFQPWTFQPPVQLTELKINGQAKPPGALLQGLRLTPAQRNFSVEFAALDLSQSDHSKTRYRYRLQGYDQDWINTDSEHRLASYGNLWPGRYTLQVQGSNRMGEWSSKLLTLPIEIAPAFWQTPWFAALMLLLLGSAIWGGYRWRLARVQAQAQAQAQALQREVKQRTAEAMAAHREALEAHNEALAAQNELALARQLEQAREQMLQQEKMAALGTLTAGVAHEINNPSHFTHVAAQIQRTELDQFEQFLLELLEPDPEPRMVAEFKKRFASLQANLATMLDGTERIQTIVKDLRAFSRREHEQKRTLPLSECLNSTLNLVRTNWADQVEFITDFAFDPPYECWPSLLNQVLMNLMVNACHAIADKRKHHGAEQPPPGHVWLRLYQRERDGQNWLVLEIEDDGCGIEPHVLDRILEPFFTTKDADTGTGLGLSIAHGIIQKHGGTLFITSTLGQGSCFTIHFPYQSDTP
jgi:signal transduction histidine kinase/ligand-binding sensor domain-containing protein